MSGKRILVVEDDPGQNRMFQIALTRAGHKTEGAASSEEARAMVAAGEYDLILLDLVLETEESGLDFLQYLKNNPATCAMPVITMSGHGAEWEGLASSLDLGATDCIAKPVELPILIAKIRKLLAEEQRKASCCEKADDAEVKVRVLVVEDDSDVQENYKAFFRYYGKDIVWVMVDNADDALRKLAGHARDPFDVALIDWVLIRGSLDGFQLMKRIRSNPVTRSILAFMVTANENEEDIKAAFNAGADDYVAKPFRDEELLARLRSRMKRRDENIDAGGLFDLDGLKLDVAANSATLDGKPVDLYPTEFDLLKVLLTRPDRILSHDHLWHAVRGYRSKTSVKALCQQIRNLRHKLGTWGKRIETRPGQGHQLHTRFPISR